MTSPSRREINSSIVFAGVDGPVPHYGALDAICPETQFRLSHQSATGQEKLALMKRRFVNLTLPVIVVKTAEVAVVRDLFIRLQAGTALSAQERRDAWPGEFPEFIKRIAGHPHGAQGFRLFRDLVWGRDDAHRRLAAKAYLLWSHWSETRGDVTDVSSARIDDLYRTRVRFNPQAQEAHRFRMLIRALGNALLPRTGKWPDYAVIHSVLLLDEVDSRGMTSLAELADGRRGTSRLLHPSLHAFVELIVESLQGSKEAHFSSNAARDAHQEFGQWTQLQADRASSLRPRHKFFRQWMWRQLFEADAPADEVPVSAVIFGDYSPASLVEDDLDLDFAVIC